MKTRSPITATLTAALIFCAYGGAWAEDAAAAESSSGQSSPSVVTKVTHAIQRGASAAATGIEKGVKAAANGVERGAKAAGRGIEKGAQATARGVEKGATTTSKAAHKAADKIGGTSESPSSAPASGQ